MEYNTGRKLLHMAEYGRHIQRMVDFLMTIDDRAKRQKNAETIIDVMGILNPQLKNVEDFRHMLWDHLFFMSDFKLDIDSPYPIPQKETYKAKPAPMPYPKRKPKYSHLGKNLELIINKALAEQDPEKKMGFSNTVAYYMKLSYSTWHKELVHDETIRAELNTITDGQLDFTNTPYIKHRNEIVREDGGGRNYRSNNRRGGGQQNFKGNNDRRNGGGGGNDRRNNNNNNNRNVNKNYKKKRY
jgi:hypothetical protein